MTADEVDAVLLAVERWFDARDKERNHSQTYPDRVEQFAEERRQAAVAVAALLTA